MVFRTVQVVFWNGLAAFGVQLLEKLILLIPMTPLMLAVKMNLQDGKHCGSFVVRDIPASAVFGIFQIR